METDIVKRFAAVVTSLLLVPTATLQAQHSLYQDVKANDVGDVITVVLMENISGSSSSDARRGSSANGGASGSLSGNFIPFEPTFGSDVSVQYDSDEVNTASQEQLLEGNISVQIVDVNARGDLIVEGSRMTDINGETHEMNLTGIVRANDVNSRNQVLSYRVANANITYEKKGGPEELKRRRGLLRRVVFGGVAIAVGAAAIIYD